MDVADLEARVEPRSALASLGYTETSEPRRVRGGWDTLLWRFQTPDGAEHSLRVYYLPRRQEIARRERIALEACARAGLPAPRVETVGECEGLPAMVLSWCPGRPILSFIEKKPWAMWRLGRLFGRTQAQLHAVAPPPEFVENAPQEWANRVEERYSGLASAALSLGLATDSLIHMDYHPLNVLSDGNALTGIVDWAGAAAGDRRADLARTEVTLLAAPVPPGPASTLLNLTRAVVLRAWRSGYEELAGPMPDYRPLMAWAGATLLGEIILVVGRPNVWGTDADVEKFRCLVDVWARQAGAAAGAAR